jgi:hypothetical protein
MDAAVLARSLKMLKTSLFRNICALAGVFLAGSTATFVSAQQLNVAQVSGQITDSTGAVIPAATVKMTETQRGIVHSAVTDGSGQYVMPGLPVGAYRLQVQKDGFKTYIQDGIELQVGDRITLNTVLRPGAVNEVVEVHAGAATVQTEEASVSNVIESKPISELPLNGRYATQLVITSGASMMAPGGDETGSKNFYSSVTISVAGGQANATNYLLDGGDNNDTFSNVNLPFPFPDALQEFSVETSSLPARNGLHPGGVVNLVTKSGTNALHGNVFEFYRGGAFNAKPTAFTPAGTRNDNLLRNQFGGTIGGKIISDKLFFFAGYQGTRQHSAGTATTHTFTPAALAGDFTALASAACQSNNKTKTLAAPFSGNKINPGLFDAASLKLASGGFIPISNDPCGLLSYAVPAIDNEDLIVGRMDYMFNAKHSLYGRYLIDDFRAPAPFNPQNLLLTQTPGNLERAQSLTLGDNYSIKPTLMNSAHVTITRRRDNRGVDPRDINPTTLGSKMFAAIPDFLLLSVSGYFGVGCGTCAPGFFNVNTLSATDDVDWIRGRHHFAFGVVAIRTQNNTLSGFDENGTFSFNGSFTGDGLADFLLGRYNGSGGLGFTQSRAQKVAYRETIPGLYAQDTMRLGKRLSVSAGLRWEPTLWPTDVFHRGSFFDFQAFSNNQHSTVFQTAPAGMLFFGDPGVPAAFTNNHLMNFAPRIGFALDPLGDGKQSIRAGYGIFYDSSMVWYSQRLTSNPPVVNQIDLQNGCGTFSNPWLNYSIATGCGAAGASQNPFPGGTITFPGNSFWVSLPREMRPMYMQQWNLSFQRSLGRDWLMSLSYLGSKSLHVPLSSDFNAPQVTASACAAVGGCTAGNENARRFLTLLAGGAAGPQSAGAIGTLDLAFDSGYANYNGFLASLQHRFAKGISLQTNYTYSKCMSNGDFNGDLRGTYFEIQSNPKADYAPCNFDIKHIYNTTLVAQSPFRHGLKGLLLGNWQFASTLRATSGWPINITDGTDRSLTGEGLDRPNRVPGQPLYINRWEPCGNNWCYQALNPAAFSVPTAAPGAFGNVGRDFLYSPGVFNFDAAVSRRFKIREQTQFEFRFEAFNAINHFNPNIGGPGTTAGLNSANFGRQIGASTPGFLPSVYDPRILQFSTKIYW